jgi:hypothetical protein
VESGKEAEDEITDPAKVIPWCTDEHSFLMVPGKTWLENEGAPAQGNDSFEAWLRDLRDKYAREDEPERPTEDIQQQIKLQ